MKINGVERSEISEIFQIEITTSEDFKRYFEDEVCTILARENKFKAVMDRIVYRDSTKWRPYDSVVISKVITKNFNICECLLRLLDELTPPYLLFYDFNFVLESEDKNTKFDSSLKIQLGSKASSINNQVKIVSSQDVNLLKSEIAGKTYANFLSSAFLHHSNLFELQSSGLRPYILIGLFIHIQKF